MATVQVESVVTVCFRPNVIVNMVTRMAFSVKHVCFLSGFMCYSSVTAVFQAVISDILTHQCLSRCSQPDPDEEKSSSSLSLRDFLHRDPACKAGTSRTRGNQPRAAAVKPPAAAGFPNDRDVAVNSQSDAVTRLIVRYKSGRTAFYS